jgi:hypothetical protein
MQSPLKLRWDSLVTSKVVLWVALIFLWPLA